MIVFQINNTETKLQIYPHVHILVLLPLEKTNEWYFQISEKCNCINFQAPEKQIKGSLFRPLRKPSIVS